MRVNRVTKPSDGLYPIYLKATVGTTECDCLLDSGSGASLIPASMVDPVVIARTSQELRAANGTEVSILGRVVVKMKVGDLETSLIGLVSDSITEVMLGADWLVDNLAVWDFNQSCISVGGSCQQVHCQPRNPWYRERSKQREEGDVFRTESPLFGGPADRPRSAYIERLPMMSNRAVGAINVNDRNTTAFEETLTKEVATGNSVSQDFKSEAVVTTSVTEQYVRRHFGSPRRSLMPPIENESDKRVSARQKRQTPASIADSVCLNRELPDDEHTAVKSGYANDVRTSKTEDSQAEEHTMTSEERTEEHRRRQSLIKSRDNHRTRFRYRTRTFYRTVT